MATMANTNNERAKVIDFKTIKKEERRNWSVKILVTHVRPHFDEVLAIYFLKKWGTKVFPGVEDAEIEVWAEGGIIGEYKKAGKNAQDLLEQEKILPIGICGGIFDEHGKSAPTAAHLVAEYLGIADLPELQQILQFCKRVDYDGHSMPFDIHSLMKVMHDFYGDQNEGLQKVFDWAMDAIEAFVAGQRRFFGCKEEFVKKGKIIKGPIRIAVVESDNPQMNRWIRWRFESPEIIVQRRTSGQIVIFSSSHLESVNMIDVARLVRMMELRGRKIITPSWQALEVSGASSDCPWWYFHKEGGQLLNGSLTASEAEPTCLDLDEVVGAVTLACALLLKKCNMVPCPKNRCERYKLGLIECRRMRYEQKKNSK